jgi:cyclic beta-1,2-glucan synthetase
VGVLYDKDDVMWRGEDMIRAEQFGPDRLAQHAVSLARAQGRKKARRGAHVLARRLRDNEAALLGAYRTIARAVESGQTITPSSEWILDNYHVVEEQIFQIKGDLPPGYYRQLPRIETGHLQGLPRVFGIAWAYVAHMDSRFDVDTLCRMLAAYQSVEALTIGELWAVAITLRIVLVENLRRAALRIVKSHRLRRRADGIADRVLGLSGSPPAPIAAALAGHGPTYPPTLLVQLSHRLRDPGPLVTSSVRWLDEQAVRQEETIEGMVGREHQRQAAMNVTVRNIITSMRQISAIDWGEIFERVSLVDDMLRKGSRFAHLDFPTRDAYRREIENVARRSPASELDVTKIALDLASDAGESAERQGDPGYYLIGDGSAILRERAEYVPGLLERLGSGARQLGVAGYLVLIVAATALVLALALSAAIGPSTSGVLVALLLLFGLVPASELATGILNRIIATGLVPKALPALDFQTGIPEDARTLVAVPAMLTSVEDVDELLSALEVHCLGNTGPHVVFALLSDWRDSITETADDDDMLLALAVEGVATLNRRHPSRHGPRFYLLHRRRQWNEAQGVWMGWERKRGKLQELNRLLRREPGASFMALDGAALALPEGIRYVVTLDADTRMPRDTVAKLAGRIAHPLNRPAFDAAERRIVDGYGIIQPRVTMALPMRAGGSWFQRVFSGSPGLDPYAAPASDLYQDLFGEGSFIGKGIYDVDAVEMAMAGRTPDNAILSHDLYEGIFARAGLASDVPLLEEFPRRYDVAVSRIHRWTRGDWQLLPWIFRRGQTPPGAPLLGRWKMFDNLRRSLFAPSAVAALFAGWFLPPSGALAWTAFILAAIVLPSLVSNLLGFDWRSKRRLLRQRLDELGANVWRGLLQSGFLTITLVHQAGLMLDAISRTLWRLAVSRRRLLDWVTAEQASRAPEPSVGAYYRWMVPSVVLAALAAIVGFGNSPLTGLVALPFVIAWAAAPALVYAASRAASHADASDLDEDDALDLRLIARRTWLYFERFVTAGENWLPPDNYQEPPQAVIAHRTSPTNIGLYLLSVASARDFGWIGAAEMAERLEATLGAMGRMERFRGHFYNWYDTVDLRPLDPQYVSSVDSGNLAGHLIAVANACEEVAGGNGRDRILDGLSDHVRLLEALPAVGAAPEWMEARAALLAALAKRRDDDDSAGLLAALLPLADALVAHAPPSRGVETDRDERAVWSAAMRSVIASHLRDIGAATEVDGDAPLLADESLPPAPAWPTRSLSAAASGPETALPLARRLGVIAATARELAVSMDYRFLYDTERQLLSIGYLPSDGQRDQNCYDLLASEARLASFFAIAKGDLPTKHWFRMGRVSTGVEGGPALVSWSGSMFEYLMPSLVMRAPDGSLLAETNRLIVERQIAYGRSKGIPWGISESAYNARNLEFTYQYSNFGVPGLGLKRGLSANTVIAPYATGLAAMVDPSAAIENYRALEDEGVLGAYGFYEAVDFTPGRVPVGETFAIVRNYMAHHQGMTIVALADALLGGEMRRRFHREPMIAAVDLLLQERHPREATAIQVRAEEVNAATEVRIVAPQTPRRTTTAHTAAPQIQILSNGRYSVMLTNSGAGYSRWNELSVTRWREDRTLDECGSWIYLRDIQAGRVWSSAYQPTKVEADAYSADFSEDRAEFVRRDRTIATTTEIVVSAEGDAEVRRVTLANMGGMRRDIELTSYAEIVLGPGAADVAHPAFSKLFVQTEYAPEHDAILAHRRKRAPSDPDLWAAHFAVVEGATVGKTQYETDRARFIGAGRDLASPVAMDRPLTNTVGTVLDPVFSLRRTVRVSPGVTTRVAFWTLVGPSREAVLERLRDYNDGLAFERARTLAWTHAQIQLRHMDMMPDDAGLFQSLAETALFTEPGLRPAEVPEAVQSALWSQGISGDLPIILVRIDDAADIGLARQLILAHEYLRLKRLAFDVVILNERASSYVQDLQEALLAATRATQTRNLGFQQGGPGTVFVLRGDLVNDETRNALLGAARAVLIGRRGSLAEQLKRLATVRTSTPKPERARRPTSFGPPAPTDGLAFFNGYGGFDVANREYVVALEKGARTPAPWINVVANPEFGFQVAADGAGYTWSRNSRENQITPWSNDPVENRSGEMIYIRDSDSGELWGPTAHVHQSPQGSYVARHGFGYSRFTHTAAGIAGDLLQLAPGDDPVKLSVLTLENTTARERRLSVTAFCEWVLGPTRTSGIPFIRTELSEATGALLARNPWNRDYGARVAFLDLGGRQQSWTGDRNDFIGRVGRYAEPAALLNGDALSNRLGAGLDPCGAMQTPVTLAPGERVRIVILLGQAETREEADRLVARHRAADPDEALAASRERWSDLLGAVQVETPDPALDLMLNGWLLYQAIGCRIWARSGFYQASGAYGFRDQLQDSMAALLTRPALAREHILKAASRQFEEGDVQHWWLPATGQGVRTHISDDTVWLAYVTAAYVATTGDAAILDEPARFIEGPALTPEQHDSFYQPRILDRTEPLFEHCVLGIERNLATGAHGLPLMGTGDWNDGMNLVGAGGRGESVWLGWFLCAALEALAPIAEGRGRGDLAARWRAHVATLQAALDASGWDGAWYRRAYFDDGTPLGSASSAACRIDSIAQSWAVLSGAGDPGRAATAIASAERELVRTEDRIALLFTPPFDADTPLEPGYIKGYPPGIRENGGQYTHGAIWLAWAFSCLGDGDSAMRLFSTLNPISHSASQADADRYKVEPYVVAADVYSAPGHVGRGGWTWYTGSAGWLYRCGLEALLGLTKRGGAIELHPVIPARWPGFRIRYLWGRSTYLIDVKNPNAVMQGVSRLIVDGKPVKADPPRFVLVDDGKEHRIDVTM